MLHEQHNETLAVNCDQYFHEKLDTYLATATGAHIQMYLLTYSPAIYASVKEAKKISNAQNVLKFAGSTCQPLDHTTAQNPSTNVWSDNQIPHKHSQ